MSLDATRWAWRQMAVTATQKFILLSLADRANESGCCWPSIRRLQADTRVGKRDTVITALKALEKKGLIRIGRTTGKGNVYTLLTSPEMGTSPEKGTSPEIGTTTSPEMVTTTSPEMVTTPVPKRGPESIKNLPIESTNGTPHSLAQNERGCACVDSDFSTFWEKYPKKTGKKAALQAWNNAKDRPAIDKILASLEQQRTSPQWQREEGRFIPHPQKWISQGQWDDEAEAAPPREKTLDELLAEKGITQ